MNDATSLELAASRALVATVQELSLARNLSTIMQIVRKAARQLTGADGATFVLKEGTYCFYADEDAIAPLWKGCKFPQASCISGWVMMNREPAVIENIFEDPRIPVEAYRPTFVRSLVMVPIRSAAPIAAIGNYWATHHRATPRELELLQTLANCTSIAMENVALYAELERRVQTRTRELESANRELATANSELEAFAYSVSHDLQAPVRAIKGFADMLAEEAEKQLTESSRRYLDRIGAAAERMSTLIRDMLALSRISTASVRKEPVDLAAIAREICHEIAERDPARKIACAIVAEATAVADPALLRIVLENLLANAWKFTAHTAAAKIEFGVADRGVMQEFFVRDNGAGFDSGQAKRLFMPFQRLHSQAEFPGSGIGLATVRRIVLKHGGEVRAEGAPGRGATMFFSLPRG